MSTATDPPSDYEVGYGKPPKASRFVPGRSGNVSGRPKKAAAAPVDLTQLLDEPVTVRERGERKQMQPKEVAMRMLIKKGQAGDRRALVRVLDQFAAYGALPLAALRPASGSVLTLSTARMPFAMAFIMAQRFGVKATYSDAQLQWGRDQYRQTCREDQALIDAAIGYPDLVERDAP